jgi:hypothetical protein
VGRQNFASDIVSPASDLHAGEVGNKYVGPFGCSLYPFE